MIPQETRAHTHAQSQDDTDEDDTGRISLSTATTLTTTNNFIGTEDEDRWDPMDLQDDPSFLGLMHRPISTSTPQKGRGTHSRPTYQGDGGGPSSDQEQDDLVRATSGMRLTRQRLANLPLVAEEAQQRISSRTSISNRRIGNGPLSSPMYAPSPSTGSSTLVDPREDELDLLMARRRLKGKARAMKDEGQETTLRHGTSVGGVTTLREEVEEDDEEEARTEIATPRTRPIDNDDDDDDERSPSPPPPFSNPTARRRGAPLESYVQSHTTPRYTTSRAASTTTTTTTSSSLPIATPQAPGSFPPISSRTSLPSSQNTSTPLPRHTGRAQILDAFNRFIQGPNGALTLSAERRAALTRKNVQAEAEARAALERSKMSSSTSSSELRGTRSTALRGVMGTPHPTGYYAFDSRSKMMNNRGMEEGFTASPSVGGLRNGMAARGRGDDEEEEASTRKPFTNTRFARRAFVEEEGDRSREQNPRTQKYEGDDSAQEEDDEDAEEGQDEEEEEEEEAAYRAIGGGRSAIEYAMAKSFIASPVKSKLRASSPPRTTIHPARPTTPLSPTMPELPPMPPTPSPQSSPTARRRQTPLTTQATSSSSAGPTPPTFRSLIKKVLPQPQPQPQPSSTFSPRSLSPPPRRTHFDPPRSSTPPRSSNFVPPSPSRTPLSKRSSTTPPSSTKKTKRLFFAIDSPSKSPATSPPPRQMTTTAMMGRSTYQVLEGSLSRTEEEEMELSRETKDEDQHLRELVEELARIVRSRSVESSREEEEEGSEEVGYGRRGLLEEEEALVRRNEDVLREAEECVREGRDLEDDLRDEEREGKMNEATTQALLQRLHEAETIDESLVSRMDALRSSLDSLGRDLGAQVSLAMQTKLEQEANKRGNWLMWGVACQFVLIWVVMYLANYRASKLYDSYYIDPFSHPALYYINPSTTTPSLSEETLALFSPTPRRGRGSDHGGFKYVSLVMRSLLGRVGGGDKGFGVGLGGMSTGKGMVERVPF